MERNEILSGSMRDGDSDISGDKNGQKTSSPSTESRTCESVNSGILRELSDVPPHERLGITASQLEFLKRMAIEFYFGVVVVKQKKPERTFECDVCGKVLRNNTNLKRHMQCHNPVKAYKCEICDKDFSDKYYFKLHYKRHSGNFPYMCGICQRPFLQKCTLDEHLRRHTGERPYKCRYCDKTFSTNGIMLEHQRTHTGEKPYKCKICSKAFTQSNTLRQHMSVHSNEDDHVSCDICGKAFSCRSYMKVHMKVHQKGNPLYCNVCQKMFHCSRSLTRHMRVHTGEKPYKCPDCGRQFSQKSNLYKHKKTHQEKTDRDKSPILTDEEHDKTHTMNGTLITCVSSETVIKQDIEGESWTENTPVSQSVCGMRTSGNINENSSLVELTSLQVRGNLNNSSQSDRQFKTRTSCKYDQATEKSSERKHQSKVTDNKSLLKKKLFKFANNKCGFGDSEIEPLLCGICEVAFYKPEHMEYHRKCHEENFFKKLFVCEVCFQSFPNKLLLTAHSKVHKFSDRSQTSCDICQQTFTSTKKLSSHRNKLHPLKIGEKPNLRTKDFRKVITCANDDIQMYLNRPCGKLKSVSSITNHNSIRALMKSEPVLFSESSIVDDSLNHMVRVSNSADTTDSGAVLEISKFKEQPGTRMNKLEELLRAPLSEFPESPTFT